MIGRTPSSGNRFAETDAPGTRSLSPSEIVFVTHVQMPSAHERVILVAPRDVVLVRDVRGVIAARNFSRVDGDEPVGFADRAADESGSR